MFVEYVFKDSAIEEDSLGMILMVGQIPGVDYFDTIVSFFSEHSIKLLIKMFCVYRWLFINDKTQNVGLVELLLTYLENNNL